MDFISDGPSPVHTCMGLVPNSHIEINRYWLLYHMRQVDAEFKLKDLQKQVEECKMKVKAFSKRLEDILTNLNKHMTQYVKFSSFFFWTYFAIYWILKVLSGLFRVLLYLLWQIHNIMYPWQRWNVMNLEAYKISVIFAQNITSIIHATSYLPFPAKESQFVPLSHLSLQVNGVARKWQLRLLCCILEEWTRDNTCFWYFLPFRIPVI